MSEEPKRVFKGVWIPVEIWDAKDLTWMQKCIAAEIDALDDGKGCRAGNEYLGAKFGSSASSIANQISDLRAKGYIVDVAFDGRVRRISIHPRVKAGLTDWLKQGKPGDYSRVNEPVKPYREVQEKVPKEVQSPISPQGGGDGSSIKTKCNLTEGFDDFWTAYPKKKSKDSALRAWKRKQCARIVDEVMFGLSMALASVQWTKKSGQFIPHPATWLNAGGWQDEATPAPSASSKTQPGVAF